MLYDDDAEVYDDNYGHDIRNGDIRTGLFFLEIDKPATFLFIIIMIYLRNRK